MSTKNPTIKRILREAAELASSPSADFTASPLESDLFEWHFTLRGPPAPSPYADGTYHGRIVLPPAYPLKPPSFRFLTPTGRFEVNREICLSISGHHEETWQPAWGIRTALVAIRSFMDTDAKGQLGGMDASDEVRKRWAEKSGEWICGTCRKTNAEITREQEQLVKESGEEGKSEEVPEELRLAYREDLNKHKKVPEEEKEHIKEKEKHEVGTTMSSIPVPVPVPVPSVATPADSQTRPASGPHAVPSATEATAAQRQQAAVQQQAVRHADGVPGWVDKAIYGILAALAFLVWKKYIL